MKLTLEQYSTKFSVEVEHDDLPLTDVIEDLVRPILQAVGYDQRLIDEALGEEPLEEGLGVEETILYIPEKPLDE